MARNGDLLREIKENCDYARRYWQKIRQEGSKDIRYLAGDPWPQAEKDLRAGKRPCIALDELNQYCNSLINDVRQNKRAIRVIPKGNGANDKTAELRGNIIRAIEYKSRAQAAYSTAFEGAVQRGYGYARITWKYTQAKSFDKELAIKRIPNPDVVYIDPDSKESDCSDMNWAFIFETMTREKFEKEFPNAEITSFSNEMITANQHWLSGKDIQVAEYWKRETEKRKLLLLSDEPEGSNNPGHSMTVWRDDLERRPLPPGWRVANERVADYTTVCQYITNGVEILEENPWPGQYIPIGSCFGKELYVDWGSGAERTLMSLIRLARDPYLLYCYYRTSEMELAGMTPKVPWLAAEGQLDGHESDWAEAHRVPVGYLYYKPVVDAAPGSVLGPPQRVPFDPPIQAMELGAESARKAIQAAMGMYNATVGRQDAAVRSGVAIARLDDQSSQGSFHFIDNYDGFLEHMGRMMEDLLDKIYNTPRDVSTMKPNDEHSVVSINKEYVDPETHEPMLYRMNTGDHDVTISTGPSSDSQREQSDKFVQMLSQNEVVFPRIADLAVKSMGLGVMGDEIAKRLMPPDIAAQQNGQPAIPPQFQAAFQQQGQALEMATNAVQQLQQEKAAKVVESQSRERIEAMKAEQDANIEYAKINSNEKIALMQEETKRTLGLAQINNSEGWKYLEAELGTVKHRMDLLHDSHMTSAKYQHEAEQAAYDRAHEAGQYGMDRIQETGLAAAQMAHEGEQNDADREQAMQMPSTALSEPGAGAEA